MRHERTFVLTREAGGLRLGSRASPSAIGCLSVSERFVVQVDVDQFDRLARPTQPLAGIAELLWNALDAEAEQVTEVRLTKCTSSRV